MRRTIKNLLTVAALATIPACSDSSGPNNSATGTYTLISIDGVLMPVVFSVDQLFTLRITAGTFTLNTNNTFSASATTPAFRRYSRNSILNNRQWPTS